MRKGSLGVTFFFRSVRKFWEIQFGMLGMAGDGRKWPGISQNKAHVRLLGTQEYFTYLPDKPHARDLQDFSNGTHSNFSNAGVIVEIAFLSW